MSFATPDMFTDYLIDGKGIHKPTNADRIRAMSDEEMSTDLVNIFEELFEDGVPSPERMKMWLQSEAE